MSNTRGGATRPPGPKYGGASNGVPREPLRWAAVNDEFVCLAIDAVVNDGDAITFGRTTDGGAYYVGCLSNGTLEKFYWNSSAVAENGLRELVKAVKGF